MVRIDFRCGGNPRDGVGAQRVDVVPVPSARLRDCPDLDDDGFLVPRPRGVDNQIAHRALWRHRRLPQIRAFHARPHHRRIRHGGFLFLDEHVARVEYSQLSLAVISTRFVRCKSLNSDG